MAEKKTTTADQILNWQPSDAQRKHGYRVFASRTLKEGVRFERDGNAEQARLRYQKCRAYCIARGIEYPPFNKEATPLQSEVGQEPIQIPPSGDGHGVQGEPATGSTNEAVGAEHARQQEDVPHETASPEPLPAQPPPASAGPVSREVDFSWLGTDAPPPEGFEGTVKDLVSPVRPPPAPPPREPEPAPTPRPAPSTVIISPEALSASNMGTMLPILIAPDMYAKPKIIRKAVVTHFCPNPKLLGIHLPDLKEDASLWRSRRSMRVHETVDVVLDDGTPGVNAVYQEVRKPT